MQQYNYIILFAVGFFTGALLVYVFHILRKTRDNREDFNKAAAALRKAFFREVAYLEFNESEEYGSLPCALSDFLAASVFDQLKAIHDFKPFLPKRKQGELVKAWRAYCCPDSGTGKSDEKPDMAFQGYERLKTSWSEKHAKKVALEKINGILKFSKPR